MAERDDLLEAIRAIEAQQHLLGEAGVQQATQPLRARLDALRAPSAPLSEGERKQITVMFADLSGFTALSETADAEDVRELVNACFERMGGIATRLGGYVDKFIGDELMVLFGAPMALEDHAARALRAALEMREALVAFNAQRVSSRARPLGMHFGINSGLVVAGGVGFEARRDYTVMGDPVNIAARLAALAPTGAIFVGADSLRLVGGGFDFEARGSVALEGRSAEVEVFELVAAHDTDRVELGATPTALRGRGAELLALRELLRAVTERDEARSAAVVGAAGIGKSRLLAEFQGWTAIAHRDVLQLNAAAQPHSGATPYQLFVDLLRRVLETRDTDAPAAVRERLDAWVGRFVGVDGHVNDALATLLGVESDSSPLHDATPRERRERIAASVRELLRAMAARAPLLLAFEDLHWADNQSLELLCDLLTELSGSAILFVLLTRPIAPADGAERGFGERLVESVNARLVLAELGGDDSARLIRDLLPELDPTPALVEAIVRKGQGNPFFVRAIVGALLDQLGTTDDAVQLATADALVAARIPDTVWGVLAERIDRLSADQKRTLQMASIVGPAFWQGLVGDLTGLVGVEEGLETLRGRDYVDRARPAPFEGDWEWTFRHVLVQEVAYAGMLRAVRREAHRRVARWLEERAGDRADEYVPLLTHHFERGEEWAKTAAYGEKAGDIAARIFAHREAAAAYRQALHALELVEVTEETQHRTIELALKLAQVSAGLPSDDVLPALKTARTLAEALGDDALALRIGVATNAWLWTTYARQGFS